MGTEIAIGSAGVTNVSFSIQNDVADVLALAGGLYCLGQEAPVTNAVPNPHAVTAPTLAPILAYVPLTQHERFHRYMKSLVSLEALGRSVAGAGIQQWSDTPYEWKHGIDGYAKRFGNSYGEYIIRQSIAYGLSSALGEDNRYIHSDQTGFGRRTVYALESTFLARRSDGTRRLSYSRLSAALATAFISREWQPPSTRGPGHALGSFGTTMGSEIGFNVVREFLPDVLHRHHQ
jgi:hypothetical protein